MKSALTTIQLLVGRTSHSLHRTHCHTLHAVFHLVLVPADLQEVHPPWAYFLNLIHVNHTLTLALGLQYIEQRRAFTERLREEVFRIHPSYPRRIPYGGAVKVSTRRAFCTRQEFQFLAEGCTRKKVSKCFCKFSAHSPKNAVLIAPFALKTLGKGILERLLHLPSFSIVTRKG